MFLEKLLKPHLHTQSFFVNFAAASALFVFAFFFAGPLLASLAASAPVVASPRPRFLAFFFASLVPAAFAPPSPAGFFTAGFFTATRSIAASSFFSVALVVAASVTAVVAAAAGAPVASFARDAANGDTYVVAATGVVAVAVVVAVVGASHASPVVVVVVVVTLVDGVASRCDDARALFRPTDSDSVPHSASSSSSMASRRATRALLGMTREEMRALVVDELGAPAYRATQIRDSLYGKRRDAQVASMTLVPAALRDAMEASGVVTGRLDVVRRDLARDGTGKLAMRVGENEVVETVGIPDASCFAASAANDEEHGEESFKAIRGWDKNRLSACVSSQVGCAMKCAFCATGRMGFKRNLSASEIVAQVLELEQTYAKRVSQVVFMGMGEPMLNLKQVVRAIRCLNEDVGIGGRHITVSTVGIPGSLRKLAKEKMQITLAVSLHAPDQETRERIVPSAKYYPIDDLLEDSRAYFKETGRRVTFEYTLLSGVNDSPSHAVRLSRLLKRKFGVGSTHVNVIPWNNIDGMDFERPSGNRVHRFCSALEGVTHTIRRTRGLEASAACGQLAGDFERRTLRTTA